MESTTGVDAAYTVSAGATYSATGAGVAYTAGAGAMYSMTDADAAHTAEDGSRRSMNCWCWCDVLHEAPEWGGSTTSPNRPLPPPACRGCRETHVQQLMSSVVHADACAKNGNARPESKHELARQSLATVMFFTPCGKANIRFVWAKKQLQSNSRVWSATFPDKYIHF